MKQSVRDLKRDRILATDGVIGTIRDVYFDDVQWIVRYLVVALGAWPARQRVMIAPAAMEKDSMNDPNGTTVRVKLTRDEVRTSRSAPAPGDPHLESGRELIGYEVRALDGPAGEVQDLVVDDASWTISDIVVDTRKWWPGGHVLVTPASVERVEPDERRLRVRMTRDEIRAAPPAR
jgi:sporulation protein YlmC with PRC-barrel domain